MPITKQISTYPSTGRDYSLPGNFMQIIAGSFLTKKTFTITDAQLENSDYLFSAFESGDIFPLHLVQSVIPNNLDTVKNTSLQRFDYKVTDKKLKHTLRFDWNEAFHQIVDTYSGTDLYIIHYDQTEKLILAETGTEGVYRGVKTDSLILNKQELFGNGSNVVYSDLDVELQYNEIFKVIQVNWLLEQIDTLFVKVDVTAIGEKYIRFTVKNNSTPINNIKVSDVSVIDDVYGYLRISMFFAGANGSYSAIIRAGVRKGCLTINTTAYLGKTKYKFVAVVEIVTNAIWGNYDNEVWGDGNNAIWAIE